MNKPSISLMPLQRGGDGSITAFHWVLNYRGAEARFWVLPTELPRPHGISDSELARLELQRFFDALEVVVDFDHGHHDQPLLRERVTGFVDK